jgi:hypothetical protein
MDDLIWIIITILGLAAGIAIGYRIHDARQKRANQRLQARSDDIISLAEEKACKPRTKLYKSANRRKLKFPGVEPRSPVRKTAW